MSNGLDFEDYLNSKRIDSAAFRTAEPRLWEAWKKDFEQMHPASFTVQKLNLINVIRRKFLLPLKIEAKSTGEITRPDPSSAPAKPGRPVIKPRTD
jgi:hypothetical protein